MTMFRTELDEKYFNGGVNDTIFPRERRPNEAKTQRNFQTLSDGSRRKIKGRLSIKDDFAYDLTGIFMPPEKIALVRLTADNNALYFKYDGSYYTASVAAGAYYTYEALADALAAAMKAACGATFNVGYTNEVSATRPTQKFYVQKPTTKNLSLLWYHENTTIPLGLFGAQFGSTCQDYMDGYGYYYWVSEYIVRFEPPVKGTKGVVATTGGLYDTDGLVIESKGDIGMVESAERPAGVWHQGRLYFNNGRRNYILRDMYLRRIANNDDNPEPYSHAATAALTFNNFTTGGATIYLNNTRRAAKLYIKSAAYNSSYYQADDITLKMYRDNANWDFTVAISYWIPELGYKKLLKVLSHDDFATASTTIPMSDLDYVKGGRFDGGTFDEYLLLEYEPGNASTTSKVYIDGETNAGYNSYSGYLDSDGIWQAQSTWRPYLVEKQAAAASGGYFCITLENADGFETQLQGWEYRPFDNTITLPMLPDDLDIKYVNIYKSLDGVGADEAVFYLQCSIDFTLFEYDTNTSLVLYCCHNDTWLEAQDEADMTSRSSKLLYKQAVWFDGYLWAFGDPAYPNRVFWCDEQDEITAPEKWAITSRNIAFGSSNETVTGGAAGLDRLIVFKENAYCFVALSGDSYAIIDTSDDGVGTKTGYSCVHVFGNRGSMFYFQGGDGHFYATDGVKLYYLSKGNERGEHARLSEFVKTLNMAALDKTFAIFDPNDQEVKWSVCTGSNITPDTTVIYSIPLDLFYFQDASADFWAYDKINDTYEGQVLLLGFHGTGTFYDRMDDNDLGAVVTAEYRNDWDLGEGEADKIWFAAHVWCGSETAGQQLLVESYLNDGAAASVSKAVSLNDPPAKQRMGLTGMSKRIGLAFKATASYPAKGARIGKVVIEGSKQEGLVL